VQLCHRIQWSSRSVQCKLGTHSTGMSRQGVWHWGSWLLTISTWMSRNCCQVDSLFQTLGLSLASRSIGQWRCPSTRIAHSRPRRAQRVLSSSKLEAKKLQGLSHRTISRCRMWITSRYETVQQPGWR
jgi:hypothetical protein